MTDSSDYRLYLESEFKALHEVIDLQFTSINGKLRDVNDHLVTLNGKVATHEKTILENLPHTILHCSQKEVLDDIHNYVITKRTLEEEELIKAPKIHNDRVRIIMLIGIFITLIVSVSGMVMNRKSTAAIKQEVDRAIQWYPSGVVIDSLKTK